MEGEVYNFMWVWMTILVSLFFCHTVIGKNISQGTTRLLALTPIICLFFLLPLNLTTMHLGGMTSFSIAWLANFKLLLFAFGEGPLSHPSNSLPISLSQFLLVACLPIKTLNDPSPSNYLEKVANFETKDYPSSNHAAFQAYPSPQNSEQPSNFETKGKPFKQISKKVHKSPLNYATKVMVFSISLMVYDFKKDIHPLWKMSLYGFQIYVALDIGLAMLATLAKALVHVELEPQFDEPYLATSLQDFWGRRWNLVVSSILRPTVYFPVKSISTHLMIPKKWASLPAVFVTFLVSGLMHELIFYYIGQLKPTGVVTCFFILHGVCLDIEIVIKKALDGKFRLHPIVSRLLTVGFLLGSSYWLVFPPLFRFKAAVRNCQEMVAFIKFVRHGKLISPYDVSCPFDL